MSFILRDYVESWYHKHVTQDSDFIAQTRLSAQYALRVLAAQCKSADWLNLLTLQLTDELIQHFKMYRQVCDVLGEKEAVVDEGGSSPEEGRWHGFTTCMQTVNTAGAAAEVTSEEGSTLHPHAHAHEVLYHLRFIS